MLKSEKKEDKDEPKTFGKLFKKKPKPKQMPIVFLRNTGLAEVMYVNQKDSMYEIEGRMYHDKFGTDWDLKDGRDSKKVKIIPEWGMYPLGTQEYLDSLKSEQAGVQHDMIRAIQTAETVRSAEEKSRGKINPKMAVLAIIAVIVVGYFIMGGI